MLFAGFVTFPEDTFLFLLFESPHAADWYLLLFITAKSAETAQQKPRLLTGIKRLHKSYQRSITKTTRRYFLRLHEYKKSSQGLCQCLGCQGNLDLLFLGQKQGQQIQFFGISLHIT